MKEDLRVCPHCRKSPPSGKVWTDYNGHKRKCAEALRLKSGSSTLSADKERQVTDMLDDWQKKLFGSKL